jgi:hypothetical protein
MSVHKKINGKGWRDVSGTIQLYDGLDLKRTSAFTNRTQRKELMRKWTKDIKKLNGYFYFIISLNEPKF